MTRAPTGQTSPTWQMPRPFVSRPAANGSAGEGVDQSDQVCAVMDGDEWIDDFVERPCKDAVRVLDGAPAAEDVSDIGPLVPAVGSALPSDWRAELLHGLKQQRSRAVRQEVKRLRVAHQRTLPQREHPWRSARHAYRSLTLKPLVGPLALT